MTAPRQPDAIDAAIAATAPAEAPHPRIRLEVPMQSGHGAVLDVPLMLTARDVADLFMAIAEIASGRATQQQAPPRGAIATPDGMHLVR